MKKAPMWNSITEVAKNCALLGKGLVKMAVESRPCGISLSAGERPLVIMANGPSLADAMKNHAASLEHCDLMAVNFAANAEEFYRFRPQGYVMADPHFFNPGGDGNVARLWENIARRVDWPMTLYVPARMARMIPREVTSTGHVRIERFNPVGVEGFGWLERVAYKSGLGMPRPRNVLIAAIMIGLKAGYREIYLAGADHSWTRTLEVDENNMVVTVQPHFYKESESEKKRVTSLYSNIRLHDMMLSFHIAFRAYHRIRRYADAIGARIYNSTPGSFIDAFPRRPLPEP